MRPAYSAVRKPENIIKSTYWMRSGMLHAVAGLSLAVGLLPNAMHAQGLGAPLPFRYSNVQIVAGGFITGIVGDPKNGDIRYARTDIGGTYRWEPATRTWTPLTDFLNDAQFNYIGTEGIGLDPNDPERLYLASGTYTHRFKAMAPCWSRPIAAHIST